MKPRKPKLVRVVDPDMLSADEVAAMIGVDRKTVYDGAGRGEIPHRRLGKRLLFYKPAIVAWLSGKAVSPRGGDGDASAA